MRITFCHSETEYLCDAQSVFLRRLLPELRERGHEPKLLLIAPREPEVCSLVRFCRDSEIDCVATYSRGSVGNNVRWCLSQLAESPPDVFVPHHCYWALYSVPWIQRAGIPCITVLHSDDAATKRLIDLFCHSSSPFCVNGAVAVSDVILEQVIASNPRLPVVTIPCGVPIPGEVAVGSRSKLKLAYFGRIIQEQKRILDIGRAFARVSREMPTVECHIWGSGEDEGELRDVLAGELGGDRVQLHGAIPSEFVYARMQNHAVIVLLSDYEGTPTSIMEGMANGLVPIVTDIGGGTAVLVEDGVTGLVVRDRDADFVNAVARLVSHPELWTRLSVAAAQRIRERYSTAVTAELWDGFARRMAESSKVSGKIEVPYVIKVHEPWRVSGLNYFGLTNDALAGVYARTRRLVHLLKHRFDNSPQ